MFFRKYTQNRIETQESTVPSMGLSIHKILWVTVLGTRNIGVTENKLFKYSSILKGEMYKISYNDILTEVWLGFTT